MTGFVNEQHVDRFKRRCARPQPGGAADDIDLAVAQGVESFVVTFGDGDAVFGFAFVFAMHTANFFRSTANTFQEIANNFVTGGGDPDFLSLFHQVANHARAGARLARPWRSLNRESRMVESQNDAAGRGVRRFRRALVEFFFFEQPRRPAQQQIAGRLKRARRLQAIRRNPFAQTKQRAGVFLGLVDSRPDVNRVRMVGGAGFCFLDLNGARDDIDRLDGAEFFVAAVKFGFCARVRFLVGEGVEVDGNFAFDAQSLDPLQLGEAGPFLE